MKHLLKHFTRLSLHPNNAKELKGLILQLGVKGKLTVNWRLENPVSISSDQLVINIKKGKRQLLLDNEVKKEKPIQEINAKEVKFELPDNWVWVRFAEVAYIVRGGSPRPIKDYITEGEDGINWIKIGDTKGVTKFIEKCKEKIIPEGLKKSRLVKSGDFILSNSMSFGRPYIMKTTGCIHDGWLLIREIKQILDQDYLYHMLSSNYVYNSFKDSAAGGVVQNLNIQKVRQTLIPIPPLEEQKAIVEVVNQLFIEMEQLESLTKKRIQLKEDFVTSSLKELTSSKHTEKEWMFLQEHFSTFFTEKSNIKKLRESILQLAVQGKLTKYWRKENPDVEDASVLLQRIKEEKTQLVKDKKIKKEKVLPKITKEEIPYELPEGWVWCRLGGLGISFQNGISKRGGEGTPTVVLRLADIKNKSINVSDTRSIPMTKKEIERYDLIKGDVLITRVNGSADIVGSFISIPKVDSISYCDHFIRLRFHIERVTSNEYISIIANSVLIRNRIKDLFISTAGQKTVNQGHISSLLFSLPPYKEQKAIVEKVNELLDLCDQLEQEIQTSKVTQEDWMKSSLREVFETAPAPLS